MDLSEGTDLAAVAVAIAAVSDNMFELVPLWAAMQRRQQELYYG